MVVEAKMENYSTGGMNDHRSGEDQSRMKYFAARVLPYNYKEENQMLLKRLQMYQNIPEEMSN